MKISIVGGGNMGGAIARGLSTCDLFRPQDITVINRRASKTAEIQGFNPELQAVTGDYSSLATADIVGNAELSRYYNSMKPGPGVAGRYRCTLSLYRNRVYNNRKPKRGFQNG